MLVLGINGGWDEPDSHDAANDRFRLDVFNSHDAAAVLLRDGEIVAAAEEERFSRVKHTSARAADAIRFCCRQADVDIGDIDAIAQCGHEKSYDLVVANQCLQKPSAFDRHWGARSFIAAALAHEFGTAPAPNKLHFVEHHHCHAMSAVASSGFEDALVVTLDGEGDGLAGSIGVGSSRGIDRIRGIPADNSLGNFYLLVTQLLGFRHFDEFKVMGLAPYGDPARYRGIFRRLVTLERDGLYRVHRDQFALLLEMCAPRGAHDPIESHHRDIAAGLQETLEWAVMHLLTHFRQSTGRTRLCLAGGVAQNCALVGVVERARIFDDLYVGPNSGDAGCALGAALAVHASTKGADAPRTSLKSAYWGTNIGRREAEAALPAWAAFVSVTRSADIVAETAQLLADGAVVGWAQGRAEFGPRALGNRSILADARPAANRDRINSMVKKREAFRPFAPSVPLEESSVYFDVQPGREYPYMAVVVPVRPEYRSVLGAISHVDGTARLQTVSRESNAKYWRLLKAFGGLTSIPVLLNTSFNTNKEPIVDTVDDCITCFLTTSIDWLVIDDCLVSRLPTPPNDERLLDLRIDAPRHLRLDRIVQYDTQLQRLVTRHLATRRGTRSYQSISPQVFELLAACSDGRTPVRAMAAGLSGISAAALAAELHELWVNRVIALRPMN